MPRRSAPQKQIDDQAFAIRVYYQVPEDGFGPFEDAVYDWLNRVIGKRNYAWHAGGAGVGVSRAALYFRDPASVIALRDAFPDLVLVDGTTSPHYHSPNMPPGQQEEDHSVCNLYSMTRTTDAMRRLFDDRRWRDSAGNLEPGSVYPDRLGVIIRHDGAGGLELTRARWGLPSPPSVLKAARDPGVTNVRNTASPHWRRWLGPANRCLVAVTSFAEPKPGGNQWFAPHDPDQQMYFAGIEVRSHTSLRKVKEGPTTDDLYAFLTTTPNAEVGAVHPKAMPVILTTRQDCEAWLDQPAEMALQLQRPLPDGSLRLMDGPI